MSSNSVFKLAPTGAPLKDDVKQFIDSAAKYCGRFEAENFSEDMIGYCCDTELQHSPIEQLLWVAVHATCRMAYIAVNPDPFYDRHSGKERGGLGLHFYSQYKVGQYRADFRAQYVIYGKETPQWIIECDGHAFHERTREERQNEKRRDRFFTVSGFKILRFTGAEIFKNPYVAAGEILTAVCGRQSSYTPKDYHEESGASADHLQREE